MSVIISKKPERNAYLANGNTDTNKVSRWVVACKDIPIYYELQRKDYGGTIIGVYYAYNGQSFYYLKFTPTSNFDETVTKQNQTTYKAGDLVYIGDESTNATYSGTYEVLDIVNKTTNVSLGTATTLNQTNYALILNKIVSSQINNALELDILGNQVNTLSSFKTAFINLPSSRTNHHVEVDILGISIDTNGNNIYNILGTIDCFSDKEGKILVQIEDYIITLLTFENKYDYETLNWADTFNSGAFNIGYREIWSNNKTDASPNLDDNKNFDVTTFAPQMTYYSNAAKQIMDLYGQNLAEFVPVQNQTSVKAKALNDERPTWFRGFPFSFDFIYSDNLVVAGSNGIRLKWQEFEDNGYYQGGLAAVYHYTDVLDNSQALYVNRCTLIENDVKYEPSCLVKTLRVVVVYDQATTLTNNFTDYYDDGVVEQGIMADIPIIKVVNQHPPTNVNSLIELP